jgi:hypothetical protein
MDKIRRHNGSDDDRLRALLRRGDPAGDGRDPAPGEIAAWRQAILAEARGRPSGRYRFLWQGALATAGLVLLVVLVIPFLRSSSTVPTAPRVADRAEPVIGDPVSPALPGESALPDPGAISPSGSEAGPQAAMDSVAPALVAEGDTDPPVVTAGASPAGTIETAPPPDATPVRAGSAALAAATARPARTIQFTAPGGTRIIWKLDPGFALPPQGEKT